MGEASTRAGGRGPTETGGGWAVDFEVSSAELQPPASITKRLSAIRIIFRTIFLYRVFETDDTNMALLTDVGGVGRISIRYCRCPHIIS
jgi:hypothetical protein